MLSPAPGSRGRTSRHKHRPRTWGDLVAAALVLSALMANVPVPGLHLGYAARPFSSGAARGGTQPVQGLTLGLPIKVQPGAAVPGQFGWWNVTGYLAPTPVPRTDAYFEFDPVSGNVILMGGLSATGFSSLTDTWEYHGGRWTNVTSAIPRPPPATQGLMAYDAQGGYHLEFGGWTCSTCPDTNYTWSFEAGQWTNLSSSTGNAPPPTDDSSSEMAYDAADHEVVLLERYPWYAPSGPTLTWTFSNGSWANVTATAGPPPAGILSGSLAYDTADDYLVQFGGGSLSSSGAEILSSGTWTFHNGKWSALSLGNSSSPPPRIYGSLAYDSGAGGLILFGGWENASGGVNLTPPIHGNDTWEFAGGRWTDLATSLGRNAPPPFSFGSMAYDVADGYLLFRGVGVFGANGTWVFGNPPPFARVSLAPTLIVPNEVYKIIVNATGGSPPFSYRYVSLPPGCPGGNGSLVTCTAPSPGNYTLLLSVTDSLNRSTNISTVLAVERSIGVTLGISPSQVRPGGKAEFRASVDDGVPPYSVYLSGLPPGCASQGLLVFNCTLAVPGLYNVTVIATDSVGERSASVASVGVYDPPTITALDVMPSWIDLGDSSSFKIVLSGGAPPLSFVYQGLPPGCVSAPLDALSCAPSATGEFAISVAVTDNLGGTVNSTANILHVQPDPAVTSFSISPGTAVVGEPVQFTLVLSGGTPPLVVNWTGLPSGCVPSGSSFACGFDVPGTYQIVANITDALGHAVIAEDNISVKAAGPAGAAGPGPAAWLGVGGAIATILGISAIVIVRGKRARAQGAGHDAHGDPPEARGVPGAEDARGVRLHGPAVD